MDTGNFINSYVSFWNFMFNGTHGILTLGDFFTNILFGPVLVFSLSTPLWFIYILITCFFFKKIRNEKILNLVINFVSIIFGLIILMSIFSLYEDVVLNNVSFSMIALQVILITFFTWIIKVDRGYVKTKPSRPDILDDDLDI